MTIAENFLRHIEDDSLSLKESISYAVNHPQLSGVETSLGKSCTYFFEDDSKIRFHYFFAEVIE